MGYHLWASRISKTLIFLCRNKMFFKKMQKEIKKEPNFLNEFHYPTPPVAAGPSSPQLKTLWVHAGSLVNPQRSGRLRFSRSRVSAVSAEINATSGSVPPNQARGRRERRGAASSLAYRHPHPHPAGPPLLRPKCNAASQSAAVPPAGNRGSSELGGGGCERPRESGLVTGGKEGDV